MKEKCNTDLSVVRSPIGDLEVVSCDAGVHSITQLCKDNVLPSGKIPVALKSGDPDSKPLATCLRWLRSYFAGEVGNLGRMPDVCPTCLDKNGSFGDQVRYTLRQDVKFGSTITYAQLATLVGRAGASRAVGSAMRRNPLSILVPCHRVVKTGGELGNYGGGARNSVKKWLLDHEAKMSEN